MFGWFKKKLPMDYTPEKIFDGADPKFRWAAIDEDGSVYLHENKPLRGVDVWISGNNSRIRRIVCYGKTTAKKVWKESLMERNGLLPAWYTAENVFKDAPEWANYAALDSTGPAVVSGADVDFGITQNNWKQSLIERPKKKEGEIKMNSREIFKSKVELSTVNYQAGDVLVTSNGEVLQYVHSGWFYGLRLAERSSGSAVDFEYILNYSDVNRRTIDAIYRPTGFQDLADILRGDVANLETVYKRQQAKEMTIAQIEKELGYSIKIVKEAKEGE